MKKNLLLLFLCGIVSSCGVFSPSNSIGHVKYLKAEIFQTLDEGSALALDRDYNIVLIETQEDLLYDGLSVSGYFYSLGLIPIKQIMAHRRPSPPMHAERSYTEFLIMIFHPKTSEHFTWDPY